MKIKIDNKDGLTINGTVLKPCDLFIDMDQKNGNVHFQTIIDVNNEDYKIDLKNKARFHCGDFPDLRYVFAVLPPFYKVLKDKLKNISCYTHVDTFDIHYTTSRNGASNIVNGYHLPVTKIVWTKDHGVLNLHIEPWIFQVSDNGEIVFDDVIIPFDDPIFEMVFYPIYVELDKIFKDEKR